jgi:hypothetical protein
MAMIRNDILVLFESIKFHFAEQLRLIFNFVLDQK